MDFATTFEEQLRRLIGETIQVATDNNLIEGRLTDVEDGTIELRAEAGGYERETRTVLIPLTAVNFVREV
ncbi:MULTISPECIES: hypothetical protein [Geobacillus]|uniref:DUF2642 domain-containing protein n=2 Tax=Geobacillus TaxID=129337 RepID=A0A7U9P704_GEOTM|nr:MULTISPECIES: hypothetical protein [Geobacillus]AKM18141.1 hypothetical protein GARCT_00843 [Geobacillus sp. 12AMOR1]QHN48609.1 hypothetical protein EPB69_04230 [Geobacillus stearothermophilus]STO36161.1 Uncharacterised protein [[Flavobacterium] thermophilum]AGE21351.1 hypothetical protein GHH_c08110 [Geobacillus sp. GHH01]AMV10153.1 hypothetical protein GT3570_04230 [Geobacillus thermoleovorans]